MRRAESRRPVRGRWPLKVLPPLVVVAAAAVAVALIGRSAESDTARDADLCPVDEEEIAASAALLFDFRKPLEGGPASLAGDVLRRVARESAGEAEMRVFVLKNSEDWPLELLGRLCKPYDNADLRVETAKDRSGERDCDDLPAQLPNRLRESATRFCVLRDRLGRRLDAMAARPRPDEEEVGGAHLVEAIEDMRLHLERRRPARAIHLLSDMMQHSRWYSHLDLPWTRWNYAEFAELLGSRSWMVQRQSDGEGMRVEVFYVPRAGLTDQPRVRMVHQEFWREHFGDAEVAFRDQPTMRGYSARRLMNVATEAEKTAEKAAEERAEAERLLLELKREQEALQSARRELLRRAEEERRRASELRAQEQEIERQRLELEREREAEEQRRAAEAARWQQEAQTAAEPETGVQVADAADPEAPPPRQRAGETEAPAAASGPPCEVRLAAGAERSPEYPGGGRVNLGRAMLMVRYVVDETGRTPDDQVEVVRDRSEVNRESNFDLFAESALETVRDWRFVFVDPNDPSCAREQARTTMFWFSY